MDIPKNILKSTLLSGSIFWIILSTTESFGIGIIFVAMLSLIPISLCCTVTIIFTIGPFFWLKKRETNNKTVFNTYFPFYALVCFSLCFLGTLKWPNAICFFASAFFTTMQLWVWFSNEKDQIINNKHENSET